MSQAVFLYSTYRHSGKGNIAGHLKACTSRRLQIHQHFEHFEHFESIVDSHVT